MRPNQNEIADTIIGLLGYVNSFENEENFNKVFATLVSGLALVRQDYVMQAMNLLDQQSLEKIINKELEGACSSLVIGICMTNQDIKAKIHQLIDIKEQS